MDHFLSFYPTNNPKNKNFEKREKTLEILSLYTCVLLMTIKWSMLPEIWSAMDRMFCHFRPFLALLPPNNLKNQTFEKIKKTLGDIIILHMCTKNNNHIIYGFWDMEHDGHNFLSFWIIFCLFTTLTTQKIKNLKKGKKPWRYYHFTHVFDKWQKFLSFWTLFHPLTPLTTWKIKILKKWQKTNKQKHLQKLPCVPYMKIIWCMVPEIRSAMHRIFCHFRTFFALLPQ